MNFKGTTNIPRDKVKGIIEQFGGYWNGYTWIDQTTYTETATRDALDRMLFIEAERMANCLYDPADCESERTVIISELQGGENDPDTAARSGADRDGVQGASVRPSDDRLARRDLQTMTRDDLYGYYRRSLRAQQRDARRRRRRRRQRRDAAGRAALRRDPAGRGRRSAVPTREPEQLGERRVTVSREGHDGVPEDRATTRRR